MEANSGGLFTNLWHRNHQKIELRKVLYETHRICVRVNADENKLVASKAINLTHMYTQTGRATYDWHTDFMIIFELRFKIGDFFVQCLHRIFRKIRWPKVRQSRHLRKVNGWIRHRWKSPSGQIHSGNP